MRDIKFRAWNGEYMCYSPTLFKKETRSGCVQFATDDGSSSLELMQYTGLKDKNGKEIYEGDILKMDSEEDQSTFEVVWKFNGWRKKFTDWPDDLPEYNLLSRGDLGFYKIIGNVYENPELLERP